MSRGARGLAWRVDAQVCLALLASLAAIVYVSALLRHSSNWPFADDYHATLLFLIDWQSLSSWADRLALLFRPHNEHRLVFNHLVELTDVALFGQVHFDHMVLVGNLCWALALGLLLRAGRRAGLAWQEMSPAVLLACTLSHHDLMVWAMGSLQQYGQILFCLLAAWAASRDRFAWSLVAASAAAGAGGGGFAVFPALAVCWASRRQWARAGLTLLLMAVWLFLHTRHLPAAAQGAGRLAGLLSHPLEALGYMTCFLGSVGKSTQASIALGALQLGCLGWLLLREDAMRKQPFFSMVALWLLTSAMLAALARFDLGIGQARSTRYTPHAITLLMATGLLAISLANTAAQRSMRWRCWAALATILWATWLLHGWKQQSRHHEAVTSGQRTGLPSPHEAHRVLEAARSRGVFVPPAP